MEKNQNKGLIGLIIVLVIVVLGFGGYITYDKVIKKEKVINKEEVKDKTKEFNIPENCIIYVDSLDQIGNNKECEVATYIYNKYNYSIKATIEDNIIAKELLGLVINNFDFSKKINYHILDINFKFISSNILTMTTNDYDPSPVLFQEPTSIILIKDNQIINEFLKTDGIKINIQDNIITVRKLNANLGGLCFNLCDSSDLKQNVFYSEIEYKYQERENKYIEISNIEWTVAKLCESGILH